MKKFSKEPQVIKKLFDQISNNYDKLNNIITFGRHNIIKKDVINRLEFHSKHNRFHVVGLENQTYFPNQSQALNTTHYEPKILDLCTGTGDLAGLLKQKYPQAKIIGVDFSQEMLNIAKIKHPEIEFLNADCTQLPFEDEQFDLCIISFGLRNVEDIKKVLGEIYRVLKYGGVFINLDLGKPNNFLNFFFKPCMYLWVSSVGKLFHGDKSPYEYLAVSNEDFPSQYQLVEIFKKAGFLNVKNKNYLFGQLASQISEK